MVQNREICEELGNKVIDMYKSWDGEGWILWWYGEGIRVVMVWEER